jgi:hypothetical protein
MKTREIDRKNWQYFFDQMSKPLQGKQIKVEVDSLALGAQIEVDKLSLNGLTYDKKMMRLSSVPKKLNMLFSHHIRFL